jgi:hypothetical protein
MTLCDMTRADMIRFMLKNDPFSNIAKEGWERNETRDRQII